MKIEEINLDSHHNIIIQYVNSSMFICTHGRPYNVRKMSFGTRLGMNIDGNSGRRREENINKFHASLISNENEIAFIFQHSSLRHVGAFK